MKILVTGDRGTLGTVLVKELRRRGHDVWGCDLQHNDDPQSIRADIAVFNQLERVFYQAEPELVYHLAAEFGRKNGDEYVKQLWTTNCIGTQNVIDLCIQRNSKLVFASSSEAYGDADRYAPKDAPFKEDWLDKYAPGFHNQYALTKWAGERQVMMAAKNKNLQAVILRFFNAYGPGEYYTPYRSVVCLFIYRMLHNLPITVYRDYRRVFMYVDDWANAVANVSTQACRSVWRGVTEWAGSLDSRVPVFNIAGTEYLPIEELKDKLLQLIPETQSEIAYLDAEKANVFSKRPDIGFAANFLGHNPCTTLDQGLPITVEWYRETHKEEGL